MEQKEDYLQFLGKINKKVRTSQIKAHMEVNKHVIINFWEIGKEIINNMENLNWGEEEINKLSSDMGKEFKKRSYSGRNINHMISFAKSFPDFILPQEDTVRSEFNNLVMLPWDHNIVLLDNLDNSQKRLYWAQKAVEGGWSRDTLLEQIKKSNNI